MTTEAPTIVSAPPDPARMPVITAALRRVTPLQGLTDEEYEWLVYHSTELCSSAGTILFHEGDPATSMVILLKGEIYVRRERGGSAALFIGRSGQISGLLPFSRMKTFGGLGYTTAETWVLQIDKSLFDEMLQAIPSMGRRCVAVLLDRVREVTRMEQQAEKLTALGKLAGNLAHELNNPASAAQRAAAGILEELHTYGGERFKLGSLCLSEQEVEHLLHWESEVREVARKAGRPRDIEQNRREDDITAWLRQHGVEEVSRLAPEVAEYGVTPEQLDQLAPHLRPSAMPVVLSQFASSLRAERIAEAMLDSTARIFDLIRAVKDYSYMDQAPIQEVDIPQGLDSTLAMLGSRLQHVKVSRDYQPGLPCISAYGSELNQVWMALLENALDAIQDRGEIKLVVRLSGDLMLIEVWDNGPGIPPELQARIFEPFFTTKAPGRGLGLGLDAVTRIVRIHRGFVTVQSRPGATCFQVRLPIEQLQAY